MWNRGVAQQGQLMLQSKMLGVQCRAPPIESRVPWGVPEYSSHGNTNTTVLGHPSAFTALLSTSWDVLGCPSRLPQRSLPVYHAQCVPSLQYPGHPGMSWKLLGNSAVLDHPQDFGLALICLGQPQHVPGCPIHTCTTPACSQGAQDILPPTPSHTHTVLQHFFFYNEFMPGLATGTKLSP